MGVRRAATGLACATLLLTLGAAPSPAAALSAPETLVTGLAFPTEPATDRSGNLYFTQLVAADVLTLSVLPAGSSAPVELLRITEHLPRINDIQAMPNGSLVFILGTTDSHGIRHAAVVRFDLRSRALTEIVGSSGTTTGGERFGDVSSGALIFLLAADRRGTLYFSEQRFDAALGRAIAELYIVRPRRAAGEADDEDEQGDSDVSGAAGVRAGPAPALLARFDAAPSQKIQWLAADPRGRAAAVTVNGSVYLVRRGGVTELVKSGGPSRQGFLNGAYLGFDASGDLVVLERQITGFVRDRCATSTTFRVLRYAASARRPVVPRPVTLGETTLLGLVGLDFGTASTSRTDASGNFYFHLAPRMCGHETSTVADIYVEPAAGGAPSRVYRDVGPIWDIDRLTHTQDSIGIALDRDGGLFVATLSGKIDRLAP